MPINHLLTLYSPCPSSSKSFSDGTFADSTDGFRLELVRDETEEVLGVTECFVPSNSDTTPLEQVLDQAFNSIPDWVDAGNLWILQAGEINAEPSTSLSYTLYFDHQLDMDLSLSTTPCSSSDGGASSLAASTIVGLVDRDEAPSNRPIYHRLHNLPGGFPDVLLTEPRSLGPLSNDPKIRARQFLDADPGEETPLGRAELMKLVALLMGSVETGNTLFETIEMRYNAAKALASKASKKPTVMVGKPGTWNEAARNSWMITVGSTYIGQMLRDANAEYRNGDDSVADELCGSGCGVCPSGTSDTRCSIGINDYLDLFQSSDYWIAAGKCIVWLNDQ